MASFQKSLGAPSSSSLSRASSSGSLYTGSAANTEASDEDSDGRTAYGAVGASGSQGGASGSQSYRERRREAHTQAEQKRRDAIKKGYDYLLELVPTGVEGEGAEGNHDLPNSPGEDLPGNSNGKISKAAVLQRSIDYIHHVQQQKRKQEEELSQLRKELIALQIMHANYEQLVKAHQNRGMGDLRDGDDRALPSDVKFEVFRSLMDSLFDSFNDRVSMREFSELSAGVFSWIEEQCKPQMLQESMHTILQNIREKYQQRPAADDDRSPSGGTNPQGFKAENASDPKI